MDYDWGEESSPTATFPLPFRVLFLICLGILGWATNLHGLHAFGLDATSALDLRVRDHISTTRPTLSTIRSSGLKYLSHPSSSYGPIYRLFACCSIWCFMMWCIYRYATYQNVLLVDVFKYLPAVAALGLLIVLFYPLDVLESPHREALLMTVRRCVSPILNHRIFFCDVILADIFTSYAKVFGDLWLSLCMIMPGGSLLVLPPQDGWSRWISPTLMSIPYLIRFRQCMIEYTASSNQSRRPLYNAIKYASSFPVIYLSTAQRSVINEFTTKKGHHETQEAWHGEYHVFRLWLLCALINSVYAFWWDITNDWGFDLLLPKRMKETRIATLEPPRPLMLPSLHSKPASVTNPTNSPPVVVSHEDHRIESLTSYEAPVHLGSHPIRLRSRLLFPLHYYPFVILVNLVLRLTWSIKLSSHLHSQSEGSLVIFWTEVAELVRRWMWVFLRVEWEVVKESEERKTRRSGGISEDEYEMVSSL